MYPASVRCRLCLTICYGYKTIFDENGVCNLELYDITTKYFNNMMLPSSDGNLTVCICLKCWHHISDFHRFQTAIFLTQEHFRMLCDNIRAVPNFEENSKCEEISYNRISPESGIYCGDDNNVQLGEFNDRVQLDQIVERSNPITTNEYTGDPIANYTVDTSAFVKQALFRCAEEPGSENDDATSKKDNLHEESDEYDDPVGVFTGGEFDDIPQGSHSPQNPAIDNDYMDLNSENEMILPEFAVPNRHGHDVDYQNKLPQNKKLSKIRSKSNCTKKRMMRKTTKELDETIAKWKPYLECVICHATFCNFTYLRRHFSSLHANEKFYVWCCERRLESRSRLCMHLMQMHPKDGNSAAQLQDQVSRVAVETTTGIYKCLYCSEYFAYYCALFSHMKMQHNHQTSGTEVNEGER